MPRPRATPAAPTPPPPPRRRCPRRYLGQRDLYARLSLKTKLEPQQQADLLAWAEAHTVLAFIARDGLLERFASHAPASWRALCTLGRAATHARCPDESAYALLADGERLRTLVADAAPAASKLMRLLPWCANPLAHAKGGTRLRTAEKDDSTDGEERIRLVKLRFAGRVRAHVLDWDEIAVVKEPSPGRDRGAFGRANLRDW